MATNQTTSEANVGDEVMKAVGGLNSATSTLKAQGANRSVLTDDDAVGILTIIGRALLKIFGK